MKEAQSIFQQKKDNIYFYKYISDNGHSAGRNHL